MKRKNIEKKLNTIFSNSVPDAIDSILTKCEIKKGFENKNMIKENNNKFKFYKLVMPLVLVVASLFGLIYYDKTYKADSIINFDVNPSVELKINKNEKVIKASALNVDGKKIIDGMDFEQVKLDVAVNALIGSMLKHGYITTSENSILVSVKNENLKKADKIKDSITIKINEILNESQINGSILSQSFDKTAEVKSEISEGKTKLINDILAIKLTDKNGNLYTFDTLSKLSINELDLLLTEKDAKLNDVKKTGSVSKDDYIGKEKAKQIAFENAKVNSTKARDIEIDFDYENGKMIYEIDFSFGNKEYEYDIDAKTGKIINKEIEND